MSMQDVLAEGPLSLAELLEFDRDFDAVVAEAEHRRALADIAYVVDRANRSSTGFARFELPGRSVVEEAEKRERERKQKEQQERARERRRDKAAKTRSPVPSPPPRVRGKCRFCAELEDVYTGVCAECIKVETEIARQIKRSMALDYRAGYPATKIARRWGRRPENVRHWLLQAAILLK